MTAVPGAVVGARPGITAPLGNARRAEKAFFAREEKPVVTLGGRFGGLAHVARHWWWANTPIGEGVRMEKGGVYMWIAREGPIWCGRGLK